MEPCQKKSLKIPHESRGNVGDLKWAMRGSNPRPSRCKRDRSLSADHGKTLGETTLADNVRPNVRQTEQETDALTAELLGIWDRLNESQRRAVLDELRNYS